MKVIKMPNIKPIKCSVCGCEYEYEQGDDIVKVCKFGEVVETYLCFLPCPFCGSNNAMFNNEDDKDSDERKPMIQRERLAARR